MTAVRLDDDSDDCFYQLFCMLDSAVDDRRADGMPVAEIDAWLAQRIAFLDAIHPGFAAYLKKTD